MEETRFAFVSEGDEHEVQHGRDCGLPLPESGDPDVTWVPVQTEPGEWRPAPACRRHWREARAVEGGPGRSWPSVVQARAGPAAKK